MLSQFMARKKCFKKWYGISILSRISLLKLGMASPWWGEMGKFDEAANEKMTQNWLGKGIHNHSFMPVSQEVPMYCVWEVKDGISESDFQ